MEIENAFAEAFPAHEIAVLGIPHPLLGQDMVAFMASRDKIKISFEEIMRRVEGKLASFKIPHEVFLIEKIPKNGIGKVDEKQLLSLYFGEVSREGNVTALSRREYSTRGKKN